MTFPEDKRKHPRVELFLKVDYNSPEDFIADYTSNASGGGVFIATNKPFKIGDQISFSISFPGLLSPISCRGEVRWCRPSEVASEENPAGIGVAFLFESNEESQKIRSLIDGLLASSPAEQSPAEHQENPFRVLLAEDNRLVRDMVRFGLKRFHNYRMGNQRRLVLVEAENGKEAWDLLQREPFDLAIIDYYMPVMDGMQVIRKLRDTESVRTLPIVVISAGGEEAQHEAYQAGADFFLEKPLMLAQLFNSLQKLLALKNGL